MKDEIFEDNHEVDGQIREDDAQPDGVASVVEQRIGEQDERYGYIERYTGQEDDQVVNGLKDVQFHAN